MVLQSNVNALTALNCVFKNRQVSKLLCCVCFTTIEKIKQNRFMSYRAIKSSVFGVTFTIGYKWFTSLLDLICM